MTRKTAPALALACACALAALTIFNGCGQKKADTDVAPALPAVDYAYDTTDIYHLELVRDRKKKDLAFLRDDDSPISAEARATFTGLKYFPPMKEFIFETVLAPFAEPEELIMATSKDKPRPMLCIGTLPFEYAGQKLQLRVYMSKDTTQERSWFIPFMDETTDEETYMSGRYLDLAPAAPGQPVTLDFNRAYNPYCAYNDRYDCPIPPNENRLPVAILAGEKKPH